MTMIVGGTLGITFPDGITTSAGNITTGYSPFIKNSSNVMSVNNGVKFVGTKGLIIQNTTYPTGFSIILTISSNTTNYNVRTSAIAAGWNQSSAVGVLVTINTNVVVGSSSTGSYALDTGPFPTGSSVTIVNNGSILGAGGAGGNGDVDGSSGGPAIRSQVTTTINNLGIVGGGGGGGGGGTSFVFKDAYGGGGGGGGQGQNGGAGGTGATGTAGPAGSGTSGTSTTPGSGGGGNSGNNGGSGGALGSSGSNGIDSGSTGTIHAGGASGAALIGKSFVNSGLGISGTVYGGQS
jgi:hypothetical protein